jgi:hypothetical protein
MRSWILHPVADVDMRSTLNHEMYLQSAYHPLHLAESRWGFPSRSHVTVHVLGLVVDFRNYISKVD